MSVNQTRSDTIYASLRRAILEQALQPGVKLPEDTIGETFGVSRTSARNALIRLASEGLVEIRPNRGAAVAMPSLEDAHEVFDIRQRLENLVISRLCERMPKDGIDVTRPAARLTAMEAIRRSEAGRSRAPTYSAIPSVSQVGTPSSRSPSATWVISWRVIRPRNGWPAATDPGSNAIRSPTGGTPDP